MPAHNLRDRAVIARIAARTKWGQTRDRSQATAPARAALDQKFLDQAGGDPVRAEHLRKAHYLRLALKSAQARRKIKTLAAEAELAQPDNGTP